MLLSVAGECPTTNLRSNPDHSRPTKTHINQGVSGFYQNDRSVSVGLQKSRLWHKNDTNLSQVVYADNRTKSYGTENCQRMRRHIFTELFPIAGDLANHYAKTAERFDFDQANHELQNIYFQLRIEVLNLCAENDELLKAARRFAEKCHTVHSRTVSPSEAYQACLHIVDH